jgi:hypothetical protein
MTLNENQFFLVFFGFQGSLLATIRMHHAMTTSGPIDPHQKKSSQNIDGVRVVGGNSHSSPWLMLTV